MKFSISLVLIFLISISSATFIERLRSLVEDIELSERLDAKPNDNVKRGFMDWLSNLFSNNDDDSSGSNSGSSSSGSNSGSSNGGSCYPDLGTFRRQALKQHNKYRAMHQADDLVLDNTLNYQAQQYAEKMVSTVGFTHSGSSDGENLYGTKGDCKSDLGKVMTDKWYNEEPLYTYGVDSFQYSAGHFTQVVWRGSKKVGFGYAKGSDGWLYGVARYNPAGNSGGYPQNVKQ